MTTNKGYLLTIDLLFSRVFVVNILKAYTKTRNIHTDTHSFTILERSLRKPDLAANLTRHIHCLITPLQIKCVLVSTVNKMNYALFQVVLT